jgi:hypothetical protein
MFPLTHRNEEHLGARRPRRSSPHLPLPLHRRDPVVAALRALRFRHDATDNTLDDCSAVLWRGRAREHGVVVSGLLLLSSRDPSD